MTQLSFPEIEVEDAILEFCGPEGYEFEAKEAHGKIGKGFWETVSAFANSEGGVIGLGLEETEDGWNLRGVARAAAMKLDLHTHFRNAQTISREVAAEHDVAVREIGGKHLIFVRVAPARRSQRPIFIKGDADCAYVRRSSGDFLCNQEELLQMHREASVDPSDRRVVSELDLNDFDLAAIERYRRLSVNENPRLPHHDLETKPFLEAIGA
ncbi:MAG: AlbA family DNA-binding domain-containing protein [Thermomicrobiales bacterium]